MRFVPQPEGTGIIFKRIDLPGHPVIPANVEYVQATERRSVIGIGEARVHTVEHVLAAIKAHQIDNLCVELSDAEPPVSDGSARTFAGMLEEAGVEEQAATLPVACIDRPVFWQNDSIHLVALPYDGLKISYTLHYPQSQAIRSQYCSFDITADTFREQIAPCRTFSLYEEVSMLIDHGLIKGGSLDNSVVVKDDVVFSKEGLHFPDEMARHKLLDLLGDLSLVGFCFKAHIVAARSGHTSNVAFAKEIYNYITMEKHA
jgi:UDP-3-O-[3-hydroxymyristoyl] N-acetylglucosamine deacetylase